MRNDKKKQVTPSEITARREAARLTKTQAARLMYKTYQAWWAYESGVRNMPLQIWELFLEKTESLVNE